MEDLVPKDFWKNFDKLFDSIFKDFGKNLNSQIKKLEEKFHDIYVERKNGEVTKVVIDGKEYIKKEV
jgi:PHD/YefM family antitoxin component YafN of YafNO toxin-antitoxin module